MTHWGFNVGLTNCFENSIPYNLWGVDCKNNTNAIHFRKKAKLGDTMWFVKPKTKGRDKTRLTSEIFAVATYSHCRMRGNFSPTNEQLGWGNDGGWNTEIYYTDFKIIQNIPHKLHSCNPFRIYQVYEPVEDLVEELVEDPVEELVEDPVEELVEDPVEEPVEELVEELVEEPLEIYIENLQRLSEVC